MNHVFLQRVSAPTCSQQRSRPRSRKIPRIAHQRASRWSILAPSWAILALEMAILARSWAILAPSWRLVAPILAPSWAFSLTFWGSRARPKSAMTVCETFFSGRSSRGPPRSPHGPPFCPSRAFFSELPGTILVNFSSKYHSGRKGRRYSPQASSINLLVYT